MIEKNKQRYGKIEKKIIDILKNKNYKEYSLRFIAEEINKNDITDNSKYNAVRNAINRLEKYKIIETKVVYISYAHYLLYRDKRITKLRMIRLYNKNKKWESEDKIDCYSKSKLTKLQSTIKI